MKYTLDDKLQVTHYVVDLVNEFWIKHKGELHNHRDFWDATLESFYNDDWEMMLDVMELIRITDPKYFIQGSQTLFDQARHVLIREAYDANPQALNQRKHKKLAFASLMHIKDIINTITEVELPTEFPEPQEPTKFETLFEYMNESHA